MFMVVLSNGIFGLLTFWKISPNAIFVRQSIYFLKDWTSRDAGTLDFYGLRLHSASDTGLHYIEFKNVYIRILAIREPYIYVFWLLKVNSSQSVRFVKTSFLARSKTWSSMRSIDGSIIMATQQFLAWNINIAALKQERPWKTCFFSIPTHWELTLLSNSKKSSVLPILKPASLFERYMGCYQK